jgi:hypothetical protein
MNTHGKNLLYMIMDYLKLYEDIFDDWDDEEYESFKYKFVTYTKGVNWYDDVYIMTGTDDKHDYLYNNYTHSTITKLKNFKVLSPDKVKRIMNNKVQIFVYQGTDGFILKYYKDLNDDIKHKIRQVGVYSSTYYAAPSSRVRLL